MGTKDLLCEDHSKKAVAAGQRQLKTLMTKTPFSTFASSEDVHLFSK